MSKSSEILMSVRSLDVGYSNGRQTNFVLRDVNMDIKAGDIVVMIGPNGAGKSTLIRTISGVLPALAGHVNIVGKDLDAMTIRERSRFLAMVYTDRVVTPALRVSELVAMGRQPHTGVLGRLTGEDRQIIMQAMLKVGIEHLKSRRLGDISDGERQKAMIARAIAQDTPIVILDEPTSFLDVAARLEMTDLMARMAAGGDKAVILSSHDIASALAVATHVLTVNPHEHSAVVSRVEDASPELDKLFADRDIHYDKNRRDFVKIS